MTNGLTASKSDVPLFSRERCITSYAVLRELSGENIMTERIRSSTFLPGNLMLQNCASTFPVENFLPQVCGSLFLSDNLVLQVCSGTSTEGNFVLQTGAYNFFCAIRPCNLRQHIARRKFGAAIWGSIFLLRNVLLQGCDNIFFRLAEPVYSPLSDGTSYFSREMTNRC